MQQARCFLPLQRQGSWGCFGNFGTRRNTLEKIVCSRTPGSHAVCCGSTGCASGSDTCEREHHGEAELYGWIAPILGDQEGFVRLRLFPDYPTLRNFVELLLDSPEFFRMFWNTQRISVETLAGGLLFGVPCAWGLAQYQFPGRKAILWCCILLMIMPFQVTMLSEYLVLKQLGLLDTLAAVILPGIFQTLPVFIMYRFFCGVPNALLEAARIDGAGELGIFLKVGVPVGSSGIFSAMMLQFLECQSMVERPLIFLKNKKLWPLALYLPEISPERAGFAMCASFVAMLPVLLMFFSGQEYLEAGIVASAIKE